MDHRQGIGGKLTFEDTWFHSTLVQVGKQILEWYILQCEQFGSRFHNEP